MTELLKKKIQEQVELASSCFDMSRFNLTNEQELEVKLMFREMVKSIYEEAIRNVLKDLWHDATKEKPEPHRAILCSTCNPNSIFPILSMDSGIMEADKKGLFKMWTYSEDFMPIENKSHE